MLTNNDIELLEKIFEPRFTEILNLLKSNAKDQADTESDHRELRARVDGHDQRIARIEHLQEHEEKIEIKKTEEKRFVIENWVLGSATIVALGLWIWDKFATMGK